MKEDESLRGMGFKSGWTYLGFLLLEDLPFDRRTKLAVKGSRYTVKFEDRYHLYENRGWVTATGERALINWWRRWRNQKLCRKEPRHKRLLKL